MKQLKGHLLFALLLIAFILFRILVPGQMRPFYHFITEFFSICISFTIFMIVLNSYRIMNNAFLTILGFSLVFVSLIDGLHTIYYKGMEFFPFNDANRATQLWIAGRAFQALTLLGAIFYGKKERISVPVLLTTMTLFTGGLLFLILSGHFPDCLLPNGLTPFKIVSEYTIIAVYAVAAGILKTMLQNDRQLYGYLLAAVVAFILSEAAFTLYSDVFDVFNTAGHLFKIGGFYFLYRGIITRSFVDPATTLFSRLSNDNLLLNEEKLYLNSYIAELNTLLEDRRMMVDTMDEAPRPSAITQNQTRRDGRLMAEIMVQNAVKNIETTKTLIAMTREHLEKYHK